MSHHHRRALDATMARGAIDEHVIEPGGEPRKLVGPVHRFAHGHHRGHPAGALGGFRGELSPRPGRGLRVGVHDEHPPATFPGLQ